MRSADVVCTARGAKRQCCQLLAPNAVHDCPVFGTFSKKYRKKELKKNTSEQLRLRTAVEFDGERKRVFCHPTFAGEPKMAAGKFNSSPVLGEVPQAEGYMTAITLLHFARHQPGGSAFCV